MSDAANTMFWVMATRSFVLLAVLWVFAAPVTVAIRRWWPEGRTKTALLDRTLTARKPWIQWLAFFACYAVALLAAWAGLVLNG